MGFILLEIRLVDYFILSFIIFLIISLGLLFAYRNRLLERVQEFINNNNEKFKTQLSESINKTLKEVIYEIALQNNKKEQKITELTQNLYKTLEITNNDIRNRLKKNGELLTKLEQHLNLTKDANDKLENILKEIIGKIAGLKITYEKEPQETKTETPVKKKEDSGEKQSDVKTKEVSDRQTKTETFYLPFPDIKGFFWNDQKHNEIKSNSAFVMYRSKKQPDRAHFSLLTNNSKIIKNALLNPKAFLKPVCEINGNLHGKKITVDKKGQLILENNKWVVWNNKKVKITIN